MTRLMRDVLPLPQGPQTAMTNPESVGAVAASPAIRLAMRARPNRSLFRLSIGASLESDGGSPVGWSSALVEVTGLAASVRIIATATDD